MCASVLSVAALAATLVLLPGDAVAQLELTEAEAIDAVTEIILYTKLAALAIGGKVI
jgi:hypothetical protein